MKISRTLLIAGVAATVFTGAIAASTPADARWGGWGRGGWGWGGGYGRWAGGYGRWGGWGGGWGAPVAAGVLGGLALGAAASSYPYGYGYGYSYPYAYGSAYPVISYGYGGCRGRWW